MPPSSIEGDEAVEYGLQRLCRYTAARFEIQWASLATSWSPKLRRRDSRSGVANS